MITATEARMVGHVDLTSAKYVQVVIGGAGQLWINVEGECRFRAYRIENLVVDDQRQFGNSDLNYGDLVTSRDELRRLCNEFLVQYGMDATANHNKLADYITSHLVNKARSV